MAKSDPKKNVLITRLSRKLNDGLQECGWDLLAPYGSDGSLRKLLGGIADYILNREKKLLASLPSRWVVVGGNPFQYMNGCVTYTCIVKFGVFNSLEEAEKCAVEHHEECRGFIKIFEVK